MSRSAPSPGTLKTASVSRQCRNRSVLRGNRREVFLVVASYWAATLAGIRPRPLSSMPCAFAQARMSRLRRRLAAVLTARRGIFPALRACSMNGASCDRSRAAFLELRSISYSAPLIPNRRVSSAGLPSRSSCNVTLVLLAIPTPRDGDRQIRAVQARCMPGKVSRKPGQLVAASTGGMSNTRRRLHAPRGSAEAASLNAVVLAVTTSGTAASSA